MLYQLLHTSLEPNSKSSTLRRMRHSFGTQEKMIKINPKAPWYVDKIRSGRYPIFDLAPSPTSRHTPTVLCPVCKIYTTDMRLFGNRYPPNNLCWDCWRESDLFKQVANEKYHCTKCSAIWHPNAWEDPKLLIGISQGFCPACDGSLIVHTLL